MTLGVSEAWTTRRLGDHCDVVKWEAVVDTVLFSVPPTGEGLWRCTGAERGIFEDTMCLNLKSTWDITEPSGDGWHCFLLRREIASAECMLTVVPRDWSEVGHVRGTQHGFTGGRGHSNWIRVNTGVNLRSLNLRREYCGKRQHTIPTGLIFHEKWKICHATKPN